MAIALVRYKAVDAGVLSGHGSTTVMAFLSSPLSKAPDRGLTIVSLWTTSFASFPAWSSHTAATIPLQPSRRKLRVTTTGNIGSLGPSLRASLYACSQPRSAEFKIYLTGMTIPHASRTSSPSASEAARTLRRICPAPANENRRLPPKQSKAAPYGKQCQRLRLSRSVIFGQAPDLIDEKWIVRPLV